jgi:hypothetical protein
MKYSFALLLLFSTNLFAQAEQTINQQLLALFTDDQTERQQGKLNRERDAIRLARTKHMVENGELKHAKDFYHAAIIFQHGNEPGDYKKASELALQAVALDEHFKVAKWLACAAEDRYLHSIGKPQVWGTQFIMTNKWSMDPFDENTKTDEERLAHGVPTLAEIKAYLEQKNTSS